MYKTTGLKYLRILEKSLEKNKNFSPHLLWDLLFLAAENLAASLLDSENMPHGLSQKIQQLNQTIKKEEWVIGVLLEMGKVSSLCGGSLTYEQLNFQKCLEAVQALKEEL